jgi:hypothetical protein
MKRQSIVNLALSFLICCGWLSSLSAQTNLQSLSQNEPLLSLKPLHEVATLGAAITGALVEGCVGAIHKGSRHRFTCYSSGPTSGFLGPQDIVKPVSLKDQPGVFPAPLMGPASLTFTFNCPEKSQPSVTPIVVRPDGTVFQGLPMNHQNSPQTVVISSPAQTGIYTLFVLGHQHEALGSQVQVNASVSSQPQHNTTLHLKSLERSDSDKDVELVSAEFVYIPSL